MDFFFRLNSDTMYFNDTSYVLTRDSLLGDSMFLDSLISLLDTIDTDIDSMRYMNDTLYLYEDNKVLSTYITASIDTALVDSLILANADTLYSIISDSLLNDTLWISSLDSLLRLNSDTLYFNDTSYVLTRDSLLGDSMFLDSLISLLDTIDTDIDSMRYVNDTLYLYEDDKILSTYISSTLDAALVDSLILANADTLYSIVSDSLLMDTTWMNQLADSINTDNQNIDSVSLNGVNLTTYIENGSSASVSLQPIIDSALANSGNTDNQTLSLSNTDLLTISNGNSVKIGYPDYSSSRGGLAGGQPNNGSWEIRIPSAYWYGSIFMVVKVMDHGGSMTTYEINAYLNNPNGWVFSNVTKTGNGAPQTVRLSCNTASWSDFRI